MISNDRNLTNEGLPQAAVFRDGQSHTRQYTEGSAQPAVRRELVAENFTAPVMVTSPNDSSGRSFVVDQIGLVTIIDEDGARFEEPFLDIRNQVVHLNPGYDERGLLSIAFHPDYKRNGRVFAFYSAPVRRDAPRGGNCTNHLSEFSVSSGDPDTLDPRSERILMYIDKPASNHNGGQIVFGPHDGYLYVPVGDGGAGNDRGPGHTPGIGNGQDLTVIYGKILRIDVDAMDTGVPDEPGVKRDAPPWDLHAGIRYGIPSDNPFVDSPVPILPSYAYDRIPPEIYAYGLRNPAYVTFDSEGEHALFAADAGQDLFEEVDVIVKGGNYGWNIREGTHCFDPDQSRKPPGSCTVVGHHGEPLIGPIVEGGHDLGLVIVGGILYRGRAISELQGRYICGYWSTSWETGNGMLLVAIPPTKEENSLDNPMWKVRKVHVADTPDGMLHAFLLGVYQDHRREALITTSGVSGPDATTSTGKVWRMVPV
jgi:glucose/arabinose dehydrogenase